MKTSEQVIYLYLLVSASGWVLANAFADLSKSDLIAITAARLAVLFPLNFMSAFMTIASIFPQSITKRKSVSTKILNVCTLILTLVFALGLNSENNISSFKISPDGPAEYTPGNFYTVALVYAVLILFAMLTHWTRNLRDYTRTQRLQVLTLIIALAVVYIFLGIGLTYFPAVGLIEYGPIAFISLGFLLYITNQTFFVKAFFSDIKESIVSILTIILIGLIITIAGYNFILYQNELNPLSTLLLSIILYEIIHLLTKISKNVTQIGYDRLRTKVLEFNSKTATVFQRKAITKELIQTLEAMFPNQTITHHWCRNSSDPVIPLCFQWWQEFGSNRPITPELIIDESYKSNDNKKWIVRLLRKLVKSSINIVIPVHTDKGDKGLVILSGPNISMDLKEYSLVELLAQNLSVSMSRSYLYTEVSNLNAHLEQKVLEQTKDINEKYQLLLQAQQRERDMIDIMGHELRTPISIIHLQFDLLANKLKISDRSMYSKLISYIENINSAISREVHLINTLLGATKIDQDKLQLNIEKLKIVDLLRESYTAHIQDMNNKGLRFSFKCPKNSDKWVVDVDKTRILEVFDNVINNAVKYTNNGEIRLQLERSESTYRIIISDTGMGISKEDLRHIGEKFYRADNLKGSSIVKPGGTGLGIYVSIGIIKKHGGNVKIDSELGKGSCFTVTIPIKQKGTKQLTKQSYNIFERLGLKK